MTTQFRRIYEAQVGSLKFSKLDVVFRAVKFLKKEPNTLEFHIFNLTPDHRAELEGTPEQAIQLSCGYEGLKATGALGAVDDALGALDAVTGGGGGDSKLGLIFSGDVSEVQNEKDPPNWVTHVEAGDGEKAIRTSRINKSFPPGTTKPIVIAELAKAMKVGIGNSAKAVLDGGNMFEAGQEFLNGVTVSGPAHRELESLVRSSDQEMSVQDGVLQILDRGQPILGLPVIVNPSTGLLGSPTIGDKGVVKFRALLNPDIVPGIRIVLTTDTVAGAFRAERCEYTGDTLGSDWFVDVEATEL